MQYYFLKVYGNHCSESDELLFDYVENLVAAMKHNGQVLDSFTNYFSNFLSTEFPFVFLLCPSNDSLDKLIHNNHVNKWLHYIKQELNMDVKFERGPSYFDKNIEFITREELGNTFLIKWGGASPIVDWVRHNPVPLYLFPKTSTDSTNYQNILDWSNNYESIYRLWRRGEVLETDCFEQLTNFNGDLNQQGYSIAIQLKNLTGYKFLYFLHSHEDSILESCPKCGIKLNQDKTHSEPYKVCNVCDLVF